MEFELLSEQNCDLVYDINLPLCLRGSVNCLLIFQLKYHTVHAFYSFSKHQDLLFEALHKCMFKNAIQLSCSVWI